MSDAKVYLILAVSFILQCNTNIAVFTSYTPFTIIAIIVLMTRYHGIFSIMQLVVFGLVIDIFLDYPLGVHAITLVLMYVSYSKLQKLLLTTNRNMLLVLQSILMSCYYLIMTVFYISFEFQLLLNAAAMGLLLSLIILWFTNQSALKNQ